MSELSERLAAEHKRVWNRLNITCLCGWETTDPPIGDRRPFIAHVAEVTEAAVRETIAADIEALPASPLYPTTYDPTSLINMSFMDGVTAGVEVARLIAKGES